MARTRHRRHGRPTAALLGAALLVGALAPAAAPAARVDRATRAHVKAKAKRVQRLTPAQKARERRRLRALLRKNPRLALSRSFLRKAAFVDYSMPLTVRLNPSTGIGGPEPSGDRLEIAWNTDTQSWPLSTTSYAPSVQQTVSLSGRFAMEWRFGSDATGYTTLGTSEALVGAKTEMVASPLDPATTTPISDFAGLPTCAPADQPALAAADRPFGAGFARGISLSSAGVRYGTINPFGGTIRGNLNLYFTFRSFVRTSCGAAQQLTKVIQPAPGGDPAAPGAARPVPVSFLGQMSLAPAITNDGQLKLGNITIDDAVTPQESTFGQIYSCTLPDPSPPSGTCSPGDGDAQPFPARVKIKKLTAELLIGDAPG